MPGSSKRINGTSRINNLRELLLEAKRKGGIDISEVLPTFKDYLEDKKFLMGESLDIAESTEGMVFSETSYPESPLHFWTALALNLSNGMHIDVRHRIDEISFSRRLLGIENGEKIEIPEWTLALVRVIKKIDEIRADLE